MQVQDNSRRWIRAADDGSEVREREPGKTRCADQDGKRRIKDVISVSPCNTGSVFDSVGFSYPIES